MVELFEIFWSAKIELRVIILAIPIIFLYFFWKENKRKQKERQQERLNQTWKIATAIVKKHYPKKGQRK
jgi:preprotein translocase subunit YajC